MNKTNIDQDKSKSNSNSIFECVYIVSRVWIALDSIRLDWIGLDWIAAAVVAATVAVVAAAISFSLRLTVKVI